MSDVHVIVVLQLTSLNGYEYAYILAMNPKTSIAEPMKTMAVYFLNLRVHIPIPSMASEKSPIKTAKVPFSGIDGLYPQYDNTIGQLSTVHAARHAFRSDALPLRHLIWAAKPEFELSMVCGELDRGCNVEDAALNIRPYR